MLTKDDTRTNDTRTTAEPGERLMLPESIRAGECSPGDGIEWQGWPLSVAHHIQDGDYRGIYAVGEECDDEPWAGVEIAAHEIVTRYYRGGAR